MLRIKYLVLFIFFIITCHFTKVSTKLFQFNVVAPVDKNSTSIGLIVNDKTIKLDSSDYPIWRGEYDLDPNVPYHYISYNINDNEVILEENFERSVQPLYVDSKELINEFFNRTDTIHQHPKLFESKKGIDFNRDKYSELFNDQFISTIYLTGDLDKYKNLVNAHIMDEEITPSMNVSATIITPYLVKKYGNLLLEINPFADLINTDPYLTTYYTNKYYFRSHLNPKKTSYFLSYKEYSLSLDDNFDVYKNLFNKTSIQLLSTSTDNIMIRNKIYTDLCNIFEVSSAQVAFTRVYFNNIPLGFYLIKENPNVQYFENKYRTSEMYNQIYSQYSAMKYISNFNINLPESKFLSNETTNNNPNYWYQGIETPASPLDNSIAQLFGLFKKPTSLEEIGRNFDYDSFLKNMALDYVVNNHYNYLYNATNYFLYYDSGKNQWNYHEGYYTSPFDNISQNYTFTEYNQFRFAGKWERGTERPMFDYLMSFPTEKRNFKNHINNISNNIFGSKNFFKRMDSIFNMIHDDLRWDVLIDPVINNTDISDNQNTKRVKLLNIDDDYFNLKKFITQRENFISKAYGEINLLSIYSIFVTVFLVSLGIISVHLFFAVFINPWIWHFSDKKTRVLPFTFLKLWVVALVLLLIIVITIYLSVRNDLTKSNFFKYIHRQIFNYIINYYGTYDEMLIIFNIILWLILNRENFLVLLGAPFVRWPSFNKKLLNQSSDIAYSPLFMDVDDTNSMDTEINYNDIDNEKRINIPGSLSDDDEYTEIEEQEQDHASNVSNNATLTSTNASLDYEIEMVNDNAVNPEVIIKATKSISEKLSIHHNYGDNIIPEKLYFEAKNKPSYRGKQLNIVAMYQNIEHGFLIVCHNSSDVLPATLECLLKVTIPMCIFIAENGSNHEERIKMKEICENYSNRFRNTHPNYNGLNIIYANLNEGSKTLAQFCLLNNLFWFGINIKYISVIDDDVLIPENWIEEEILAYFKKDPKVKALAYPITASNRREGMVPAFQNFEYILSMYSKKIHRDIGTVVFPSGAMGTWSIEFLLECLYLHDTVFRGDDLQLGLRLHTMYGKPRFCNPNELHEGNYKIEIAHVTVDTLVPGCYIHLKEFVPHFIGKHLKECNCGQYSLSRQRIVYWEPARHRFFLKFLKCVLHKCRWNHRATLTAKFFCLDFIVTIINDYAFLVLFVFMFLMQSFLPALMIICICFAIAYISLDVFNLVIARGNPTIKLPFEVCVVFPIFYQYFSTLFYRISTIIYTLIYYVPFVRNKVKIKKRALNKNIGNMTMSDIITEMDSEKAIANVSDITEFLISKQQLKHQYRRSRIPFKKRNHQYKKNKKNDKRNDDNTMIPSTYYDNGGDTPSTYYDNGEIPSTYYDNDEIPSTYYDNGEIPSIYYDDRELPSSSYDERLLPSSCYVNKNHLPEETIVNISKENEQQHQK